jgi:probable F420-dependent oxidoreductase
VKVGVQVRATDESPDLLWIARQVEDAGIESLFLPEHTHVPVDRQSRHPGGEELMTAAARGLEQMTGLAVVAAVTTRLRIGTGVCLAPQHDPILLAKAVSTIDHVSGGRFIFGVGAGWNREEMANHGVDPAHRWGTCAEIIGAMTAIWTSEEANYQGQYVKFGPIRQRPKPIQRPRPPVLIGGEGPKALDRVIAFGDGWIPNDHLELLARTVELNVRAEAARRPTPVPVTAYAMEWGRDRAHEYAGHGIERVVYNVRSDSTEQILEDLDRVREAAGDFMTNRIE